MSEASASPKAPTFGGYGDVLDNLVQKRKDKQSAVRFFKKLMKGKVALPERSSRINSPAMVRREKKSCPLQCIAMNAMRIIVLKYRTSIPEHRSGRCDGSNHLDRRNVS